MTTSRRVMPEILDGLDPGDPRARRSRADLQRINALMGNDRTVARLLRPDRPPRILEIGAGDGAFLLRVAQKLPSPLLGRGAGGEGVQRTAKNLMSVGAGDEGVSRSCAILLDRQPFAPPEGFARLGWHVETVTADVFTYLEVADEPFDAVVANLFLHHFEDEPLRELLGLVALRTGLFVACEPRRSDFALSGTRFLRAIGCNEVTRHDARVSVLAGFRDRELSALWPGAGWQVEERGAPPFGHAFRAVRR